MTKGTPVPVIALRDLVFFPGMVLSLLIGRPRSTAALTAAGGEGGRVLLLTQKSAETDDPASADLHRVGTLARIIELLPTPEGPFRVVLEGERRTRILRFLPDHPDGAFRARIPSAEEKASGLPDDSFLREEMGTILELHREYLRLHPRIPEGTGPPPGTGTGTAPVRSLWLVAGHLLLDVEERQEILNEEEVGDRARRVRELLEREVGVLRVEARLEEELRREPEILPLPSGRSAASAPDPEWEELRDRLRQASLPPEVRERGERELRRLRSLGPGAPEAGVLRGHLDWILSLPWSPSPAPAPSLEFAEEVLNAAHAGLKEVKDRILDQIAVLSLMGAQGPPGPILCLLGPPGVGKTSLATSIARALGRPFARISLGGIRDEAEIRGHRRTYVGALPGRILQGIRKSGARNPVFLLDEIDKMARDGHGDPGAALLEVLDPEQNRSFIDHYLELEFDLSDVLWITTANTLAGIPDPLRDRMEIIRIPGYLETEKIAIARSFLWPRLLRRHGLEEIGIEPKADALARILSEYTREAGVRELERRLARIARKLARRLVGKRNAPEGATSPPFPRIDASIVREFLGPPPYPPRDVEVRGDDRVGIANGLAWNAAGGEVIDVEVSVVPGEGDLLFTGTLGEVMKESALAAVTYARARASRLGLSPLFHREVDVHVHLPEGATPKDGPSAGITIAVALISALTGIPTRPDVAMTGEITLRGRVLGVGGIREKVVAAARWGIGTVLLPAASAHELALLPDEVREAIRFLPVSGMDEVLDAVLTRSPFRAERHSGGEIAPWPAISQ